MPLEDGRKRVLIAQWGPSHRGAGRRRRRGATRRGAGEGAVGAPPRGVGQRGRPSPARRERGRRRSQWRVVGPRQGGAEWGYVMWFGLGRERVLVAQRAGLLYEVGELISTGVDVNVSVPCRLFLTGAPTAT